MLTGRTPRIAVLLPVLCLPMGCAQPGPLRSYRANVGSLKASVSHLEYENEQLQKRLADLDSKNREIGDRLVQEEATNGDLTARLDDARNELRRRGLELGEEPDAADSRQRTLPAGRSNRKKRKTPFAQIPGRIDTEPSDEDSEESAPGHEDSAPGGSREEFGPQSRRDDGRWLPVARVPDLGVRRRR